MKGGLTPNSHDSEGPGKLTYFLFVISKIPFIFVLVRLEVPETVKAVAEVDFRVEVPLTVRLLLVVVPETERFPLIDKEGVDAIVNLNDWLKTLLANHPNNNPEAELTLSIAK